MGFFEKYKKFFFLAIFLGISFLIGFLIFNTFFKPQLAAPGEIVGKPNATSTPAGSLPGSEEGGGIIINEDGSTEIITGIKEGNEQGKKEIDDKARGGITKTVKLNEVHSLNPSLADNGSDVRYYNRDDGRFYKINADGGATLLSDKIFHNVEKISWSPKEEKAILEYPDGSNIVYDFESEEQVTLPKHWEDFSFSDSGDKIAMKSIGLDESNNWLAIANTDGSKSRILENIGKNADKVYPSWSPNGQTVALYTEGVDLEKQEVFFVGQNGENFKSTTVEGRGFQSAWSTTGDKLLYSVYSSASNLKPKLWVVNAQGDSIGSNRRSIGLETWAEKCTFGSNEEVYCAVPEEIPEGAGLFPELALNTKDRLYKINLNTGVKKLIAIPDDTYNMSDLMVSEDGKNLFFTDQNSERLHKIELK